MFLLLLSLLFALPSEDRADGLLSVHFFDVGQGDAVLVESPSGQVLVYDGGPSAETMLAHLAAVGVDRVDLVVASHNHADHIGGLVGVVRHYRPRFYMDNGIPAATLTYRRLLEAVEEAGSQLLDPSPRRISLGEVTVQVLPPPGNEAWEQNDNSIGLIVEYGEFRLSLAGDAERRQWHWWLEQHADLIRPVQVHKASHHGSRNGDTAAGIAALAPEAVVISAGTDNRYGHPHNVTLELYRRKNAAVYRTDRDGTILIEADAMGRYAIHPERGEAARPPPQTPGAPPAPITDRCVDLNTADLDELQRIVHIGPDRAEEIVKLRRVRPFPRVNELTRVPGIGQGRLRDIIAEGLACVQP